MIERHNLAGTKALALVAALAVSVVVYEAWEAAADRAAMAKVRVAAHHAE